MAKRLDHKDLLNATGGYDNLRTNDKSFKAQSRLRTIESWQKQDKRDRQESTIGVLKLITIILLFFAIVGALRNQELFTFKGLLDLFQNAPQIDLSWLNWETINLGDWGLFNFLRDFFNFFIEIVNVLAFAGTCIVQALLYVLYFIKALLL